MSNQQSLKELQKVWYQKLKDEGFKDIEQEGKNGFLKEWSRKFRIPYGSQVAKGYTTEDKIRDNEVKETYYRLAGHFLYDYKFKTETLRNIWELHSEGVSYRNIAKILGPITKKLILSKDNIRIFIQDLRKEMKELYRVKK